MIERLILLLLIITVTKICEIYKIPIIQSYILGFIIINLFIILFKYFNNYN